nr:hypothetical protein B0A51_10777 [Rachicladosporium sp. CCFEE 5018]
METTQTIDIDGIAYYTSLSGPANGPVAFLVHALMSNHHMFDSTIPALHSAGYRTLVFDHIGHNLTPPPSDSTRRYSTEDIVHHMHVLVPAATGSSKLKAVIGCSIGGVLALRYGMLYPTEVESILSLCAPGITSPSATKTLWGERIDSFQREREQLCQETVARWFPGETPHDEAVRASALELVRTCSFEAYKILVDAIRGYDYAAELGKLKDMRCLVLAGGRDGAVSVEVLRELAEAIEREGGDAQFGVMVDAGHLPPMHRAENFERIALRFLDGRKLEA